jgi:hypothetical protein
MADDFSMRTRQGSCLTKEGMARAHQIVGAMGWRQFGDKPVAFDSGGSGRWPAVTQS